MKLSALAVCLVSCLAPAVALSFGSRNTREISAESNLKVPGESPVEFCDANRDADILEIESIDFSPNQLKGGAKILVTAKGSIRKTITEGSYIKVTIKYGLIQLLSTTADLCEQAGNADLKCPLEAGDLVISKSFTLPSVIPPGTYNIFADAYSDDDEHIACLKGAISIPRPT